MKQGPQSPCSGTTQRDGAGRGVQDGGTHVYLWLIHVDVWQKSSQYCKVIILQLNKSFFFLSRVNHHQKHPALLNFFSPLRRQPGEHPSTWVHPSHLWLFKPLHINIHTLLLLLLLSRFSRPTLCDPIDC